jgi:hypothetical protein
MDPVKTGDWPESLLPSELPPPPPQLLKRALSKTPPSNGPSHCRLGVLKSMRAYGDGGSG